MEIGVDLNLTRTKTVLPRRPAHHLTRSRLLRLFYSIIDYRIFLVIAPAGYGKTSALVDWAHEADLPICWYAVDELDRDPRQFIAYVIAALEQRFEGFGAQSKAALHGMTQELDLARLVHALANDAYEHIREHFALVIDDYHLVQEDATISAFVSLLAQQIDENAHIVLVSRTLLTLPELPLMVARAEIGGLGYEELAFRADEVQDLVLQNYHLTMPATEAQTLIEAAEGWITGLLLSAHTMWEGMTDRVRTARTSGLGLYDYMAQQIIDQQPAHVREFLLRTSLFDVFNAELCEVVFNAIPDLDIVEPQDWHALMGIVQRSNLFVVPVGNGETWLRYHHLFRDFLRIRMERERPKERETILYRIAEVYRERHLWDRAHDIYERLGDWDATADLVVAAGPYLIREGQNQRLRAWLGALPHAVMAGQNGHRPRPGLLSLKGVVASMLSDPKVGLQLQRQAEEGYRALDDWEGRRQALLRMAVDYRLLGDYESSLHNIEEVVAMVQALGGSTVLEAEACRAKGLCLYWMGRPDAATDWLEKALVIYEALNDAQFAALVRMDRGIVYMDMGAFAQALDDYQSSLRYWSQTEDAVRQATLHNNLGVLHHYQGNYREAVAALERAIAQARQSAYIRMEGTALAGLGDIYEDLGAYEAAESAYREALHLAQRASDNFLSIYITLAQADLACTRGRFSLARTHLEAVHDRVETTKNGYQQGLWRLVAGRLALYQDDEAATRLHLEASLAAFDAAKRRLDSARVHIYLAAAHGKWGRPQLAENHLDHAFALATSLGGSAVLLAVASEFKITLTALKLSASLHRQLAELLMHVASWEADLSSLRRDVRRQSETITLSPPTLILRGLGNAQVVIEGRVVSGAEWQAQVARDMVFCLLAHPQGLSGENLGLFFWPDKDPVRLNMHLKKTLYRIRRALGENAVLFEDGRYRFNYALDFEYDVEVFEENIAAARATKTFQQRLDAYEEAIRHYGGAYLADMDGTWVLTARERLWQAYREAALAVMQAALERQDFSKVLSQGQRLLTQDPCQEDVHCLIMRAHAALGNRTAVMRQFEHCKQLLARELEVTPSPQTASLYATLLS
jgi:LuxR family transcriptional regulator, maltose regulon positive regulatory protein